MKRVLTVGVFDLLHLGHLRLFVRARSHGDYLIVAVQNDEFVKKFKPNAEIIYNTEQRLEMVRSIRYVDEAISYKTVDEIVQEVSYDTLIVGEDQNNENFRKAIRYSETHNKQVVVLERTKDVSSSELKRKIDRIFW